MLKVKAKKTKNTINLENLQVNSRTFEKTIEKFKNVLK